MTTSTDQKKTYIPSVPVPPGETLLEVLEERQMTQAELARRLNRPLKTINEIVKGKTAITPETSLQLEQVLGIEARFWNNLEAAYRELKTRLEMEATYLEYAYEAAPYPYKEMAHWGWVPDTRNAAEKVRNLLSFFAVTSFQNIIEEQQLKGAFRISSKHEYSIPAITAWLRKGVIDSESIATAEYDGDRLRSSLGDIRGFTRIENPQEFLPLLRNILAGCGIALVVTPSLPKAPINGSARWLRPTKAVIQLSIRYKYSDIFWFTLFHEIAHILFEKKKDFTVDFVNRQVEEEKERRADRFACDTLIPPEAYQALRNAFRAKSRYTSPYSIIEAFADDLEIHPGVVSGRLQHDSLLPMDMNKLRVRFEWTRPNPE